MGKKVQWLIKNGQVLNVFQQQFEQKDLWVDQDKIIYCGHRDDWQAEQVYDAQGQCIVPGLIDAHVHIESSLLTPSEFGRLVLANGVTRIFADPHEIASVAGKKGIEYMLASARQTPLHIHYMLPSSVPATPFEHTGATLSAADLKPFYKESEVNGLAEVMDFPAVAQGQTDMLTKIRDAQAASKHVDGHAAGLGPTEIALYRAYGIDTDHEATSVKEAQERVNAGMAVFIREGTVERDEVNLLDAVTQANYSRFAFATDDKTAADIVKEGSINYNVRLAIDNGLEPELAYTLASYNAAQAHHIQNVGALAAGFIADFVILNDLKTVAIDKVMVAGQWFADEQIPILPLSDQAMNFTLNSADLTLPLAANQKCHVIEIMPHHITTRHLFEQVPVDQGKFAPNSDYAKIMVVERYHDLGHGIGIIKGFDFHSGAIASSIAHDSHNLIAAGVNDDDIYLALQTLRKIGGGQVIVNNGEITTLPLPIGGLMSNQTYETVISEHQKLLDTFKTISNIDFDPFLTLSFMALPVIPSLKITDQGLFNFDQFKFIDIQEA